MLIAAPYRDFDVRDKSPPKVISEVRKTYLNSAVNNLRPRLSADLLVKCASDKNWHPRKVQVRGGQLHVSPSSGGESNSMRMPLRHLSLRAGPLPHSLAVCRGQNVVLTLQTVDEKSFDQWVKTLAIELIRQTPLDAIKYLDILTLAECWSRRDDTYPKDCNFNYTAEVEKDPPPPCIEPPRVPEWNYEKNCKNKNNVPKYFAANKPPLVTVEAKINNTEEEVVENLLKKCQNVETYVPVKEKLFLFESLCKMGRKVRSSEDVSLRPEKTTTKRAKSCHDLSNLNTQIAVREICKYFEDRGNIESNNNQLPLVGKKKC